MYGNFNQPTLTNAKQVMEYDKKLKAQQAQQREIKTKEKAEEEAFRNLQINQSEEANKIAKASLMLSVIAVVISIIIGIGSIYVTIIR